MDGWTIVLLVGLFLILLLVGLMAVVTRAAARLSSRAEAVLEALEEVRVKTAGLEGADPDGPVGANGGQPAEGVAPTTGRPEAER